MISENRQPDLSGLQSLIHLESELLMAASWLNVFGSPADEKDKTHIAYWVGYAFTLYGLASRAGHSPGYAEVAAAVCSAAASINEQDWEDGCHQAEFELSQLA
ncbi:hypothetical protein IAE49_10845 [Kosakonia sp. S58]|uniref:hypothetical protein n=1 Tax=unclassified Kosakonia TaxID=2632876 RepID=UPI0019051360|nr:MULTISPECIES: hypothetical protein [unclassified Kosakonia]MBK0079759.1 hypothetical protein [Kosakonia sp. S57]MBK0086731.1 hypothetical protein [Kosakonia sp. S58]